MNQCHANQLDGFRFLFLSDQNSIEIELDPSVGDRNLSISKHYATVPYRFL